MKVVIETREKYEAWLAEQGEFIVKDEPANESNEAEGSAEKTAEAEEPSDKTTASL
jgi:heme/copper-type cytochrome/quinol oxidase subunit 2